MTIKPTLPSQALRASAIPFVMYTSTLYTKCSPSDLHILEGKLTSLYQVQTKVDYDDGYIGYKLTIHGKDESLSKSAKEYSEMFFEPQQAVFPKMEEAVAPIFSCKSIREHMERKYMVAIMRGFGLILEVRGSEKSTQELYGLITRMNESVAVGFILEGREHLQRDLTFLCDCANLNSVEVHSMNELAQYALVKYLKSELGLGENNELLDALHDDTTLTEGHGLAAISLDDRDDAIPRDNPPIGAGVEKVSSEESEDDVEEVRGAAKHASRTKRRKNGKSKKKKTAPPETTEKKVKKGPSPPPICISDEEGQPELRHVVIDGSNIAFQHGGNQNFSPMGIIHAIQYFRDRGHKEVTCLLPRCRQGQMPKFFETLERQQMIIYTPSRTINGRRETPYDDRLILQLACDTDGVIVSNDQYRDLMKESQEFSRIIETRLLGFYFVGDRFYVPQDPHGPGSSLDQILRKNPAAAPPPPIGACGGEVTVAARPPSRDRRRPSKSPSEDRHAADRPGDLFSTLRNMFPGREDQIQALFRQYRAVHDVTFFVDKLLES